MDIQKIETCALSDGDLAAVSGGKAALTEQQQTDMENKKQMEALKAFQQALRELP
jgi:hypothetical protein